MTIGVGVEGPSDKHFWDKLLQKHFAGVKFDVRIMKSREKLIRETPQLLTAFRNYHYSAGFILVDLDKSPCIAAVRGEFDATIQGEAKKPTAQRFLFVCMAIRELEAWFLADGHAIALLLPRATYSVTMETGSLNAEDTITRLWRQQYGRVAFNKIHFAKTIAPKFNPEKALRHSVSFRYFWERMKWKAGLSSKVPN